jgi:hypothetical protein
MSEPRKGDDAAVFGADAELALSLDRRTSHGSRMWPMVYAGASAFTVALCLLARA